MLKVFRLGPWAVASAAFPIAADALHLLGFDALNAFWLRVLGASGLGSAAWLAGVYLLWLVSLVMVGWLAPEGRVPTGETTVGEGLDLRTVRFAWPKLVFFYPTLGFGVVCLMAIGQAALAPDPSGSEGLKDAALGVAIALFVFHLGVASVDVRPRYAPGRAAHFAVVAVVVLVGQVMLNLATAMFLNAFGPDPARPETLASAATTSGSELMVATLLFVLFFAGPRFTSLSRHFTWGSLVSGLAFVIWELYGLLDRLDL